MRKILIVSCMLPIWLFSISAYGGLITRSVNIACMHQDEKTSVRTVIHWIKVKTYLSNDQSVPSSYLSWLPTQCFQPNGGGLRPSLEPQAQTIYSLECCHKMGFPGQNPYAEGCKVTSVAMCEGGKKVCIPNSCK